MEDLDAAEDLDGIDSGTLHLRDVDIVDGTPLLCSKLSVVEFGIHETACTGRLEKAKDTREGLETDE